MKTANRAANKVLGDLKARSKVQIKHFKANMTGV